MPADRDRVRNYYANGRELDRLVTDDGWLEHERTLQIVQRLVPAGCRVLDLGGGPGRATVALAGLGYRMTLVDLSPELVDTARRAIGEAGVAVDDVVVGDALAIPIRGPFDAVLCAGPAYHVGDVDELARLAAEIGRVLRPGGIALVTFMPKAAGLAGLLARAGARPDQVPRGTLTTAWTTGVYQNPAPDGFTEAFFADPVELISTFEAAGFADLRLQSLRGLGASSGAALRRLRDEQPELWAEAMALIDATAELPEVVSTGLHAMLTGRR